MNQDIIRQQYEQINRGELDAAVISFAEDVKTHGRLIGRNGFRLVLDDLYTTFPDLHQEIIDMVAEGDTVIVRVMVSGTHKGVGKIPINGGLLVGVEPTGKHFEVQQIHWYKLHDGRIVEHWANRDDIGMMQQLGLLPQAPTPNQKQL
ncbi:ester cyclase [Leptolyngbya sp. FACHB-36]|uniref:ester cyclase n=1 Tax=Leptolyngbya sp. FACHB-36 TaxID=2692808 RepID=UPI0016804FDC|nr:ester cyclase [Leptolyngbya sp. FACHB-36]MBD2021522.1 ester cyclase [Leptolyngbya sp. FACHB-36]